MEKLTEKRCYRCGKIKPLEEFNKNKSKPSGHCDECRECKKELDLQYRSCLLYTSPSPRD